MRWKWLLQRTAGGLQRIPGAAARIVASGQVSSGAGGEVATGCRLGLTAECLGALLRGEAPVVVCRGAISRALCTRAADRLEALSGGYLPDDAGGAATRFTEWRLGADPDAPASDYKKLGYTKTDVLLEEGVRMAAGRGAPPRYLERAAETCKLLETEVFAPQRCPIDEIQEELNGLPGFACQPERCPSTGRPFLPCVVRRMEPGGRRAEGNVHMDTAVPGQTLSANVYLRVPEGDEAGGELVLYPVEKGLLSRALNSHFFETLEVQNFYPDHNFYTSKLLESGVVKPIVYRPAAGDVVFLDPAYPHAVRDFDGPEGTHRISLQTFFQCSWTGPWYRRTRLLEYAV